VSKYATLEKQKITHKIQPDNCIGGIVRPSDIPRQRQSIDLVLLEQRPALFLVLKLQATTGSVKHAARCLFLRYKEGDLSGWPSIFSSSSFQLEAHWARCSLVLVILSTFSIRFYRHALQSACSFSVRGCSCSCACAIHA
jgi:hypothetical protein